MWNKMVTVKRLRFNDENKKWLSIKCFAKYALNLEVNDHFHLCWYLTPIHVCICIEGMWKRKRSWVCRSLKHLRSDLGKLYVQWPQIVTAPFLTWWNLGLSETLFFIIFILHFESMVLAGFFLIAHKKTKKWHLQLCY